jgi:gliding motility-associated protein GldL
MRPGSKKWKKFMAKLYGFGAAVVIVGAMFKIMHWPGAGLMLIIGLSTEAIIFMFSAFEPLHDDPKWELVYPELALAHNEDFDVHSYLEGKGHGHDHGGSKGSVSGELDKMLEEAKIDSELIKSLGNGLTKLSESSNKIGDMTEAHNATNNYIDALRGASTRVSNLSEAYEKASTSIMGLASSEQEGRSFGEQMMKVSQNLASLNNVYEMQLKGASEHLETSSRLYGGINELMKNLHDSVDDTRKYKETMSELSKNLTALNTIYGNMLNAMNYGGRA